MTAADAMICRNELQEARAEAKRLGVKLPKRMTAIRSGVSKPGGEGWFLVESRDGFRKEIWAFNATQARAKAILGIVDKENDHRRDESEKAGKELGEFMRERRDVLEAEHALKGSDASLTLVPAERKELAFRIREALPHLPTLEANALFDWIEKLVPESEAI